MNRSEHTKRHLLISGIMVLISDNWVVFSFWLFKSVLGIIKKKISVSCAVCFLNRPLTDNILY